ncbi:MAG: DNA mismatch repair endonuclease MutL [Candidatus Dasytiphilus stammeri]
MPIQKLPIQITNQIAAGEVVERPASVVKELLENSLDAGANTINIDINKGGVQLIRVRDNGCGINKNEMRLALDNHTTSKISTFDDLNLITSFGFRGEALASISSVSRFKLISRTKNQTEAWQAYIPWQDRKITLIPIAHPIGTTSEVYDLFYNTPARRKFLKTEKTEFLHIDEVVRRIALARFDVSITLTHNGKLIRQYLNCVKNHLDPKQRIAYLCKNVVMSHVCMINWQNEGIKLHGWVLSNNELRVPNYLQYFYVNGRIVQNRLVHHAIRQAYHDILGEDRMKFILYLDINPKEIDINVHPTKHDVRFYKSRLIYEFIYQGLVNKFKEYKKQNFTLDKNQDQLPILKNTEKLESYKHSYQNKIQNFGKVLSILKKDIALVEDKRGLVLIALSVAQRYLNLIQLQSNMGLKSYPLLIPLRFNIKKQTIFKIINNNYLFQKLGIHLVIDDNLLVVRSVPLILRYQKLYDIFYALLSYLSTLSEISETKILNFLRKDIHEPKEWNISQAMDLFYDLANFCPDLICSPPRDLLQRLDIHSALSALKNHDDKKSI